MASSEGRKSGRLIAYDAMAVPGRSVSLVAELVEEGFLVHPPLGGEVVLFQHQGRTLGRTMTGGDGRAGLSFVPRALGVLRVTVRLAESPRVAAPEAAAAGLFVWDRRRPLVLVSLSALAPPPRGDFPSFGSGEPLPDPEGGALRALAVVARRAHLLYVTERDRLELPEVRQWADRHRLPAGPIFPLKPGPRGLASELDAWRREGWTHLKGGLVGTAEEAKALAEHGLRAVASPAAPSGEKWPDKTAVAKDWEAVAREFN